MAILSAMINAAGCFYPRAHALADDPDACSSCRPPGCCPRCAPSPPSPTASPAACPLIYPKKTYKYTANFLHMMFSEPYEDYDLKPEVVRRPGPDLPAPRRPRAELLDRDRAHGGLQPGQPVRQRRRRRLRPVGAPARRRQPGRDRDARGRSTRTATTAPGSSTGAKDKDSGKQAHGLRPPRLQELRSRAPRSSSAACDELLAKLHISDPLLDIAKHLEEAALQRPLLRRAQALSQRGLLQRHHHAGHRHPPGDVHRDLLPSGACPAGSPTTRRSWRSPKSRIYRPRQIYTGQTLTHYVPIDERK